MFDKKKDEILLAYIECGDGLSSDRGTDDMQVGLLSIGTFLKENNYKVRLAFDRYPDPEDFSWVIPKKKIKMVGFYTTADNITRVIELTEFIKKNYPEVIVIYGGPQATVRDEDLAGNSPADIVVRYEGEYTLLELADYYFLKKGSLEDIKGITYKKEDKVKKNPDRPFIEDLDALPIIDRDLLPFKENYPVILTGRGCPYNCTFCFQGTGHVYRMRSIENVLKEVDSILDRYDDPLYMGFMDDTFTAHVDRTLKLCKELKKRKEKRPDFYWYAEARANILYNHPELIPAMKEAGLVAMQFGIESINKEILELYKKLITPEQVEFSIKKCVEEDIFQIVVSFILGGPYESRETIEENLNFAKKLIRMAPGRIRILNGYLSPLPGTPLGDNPAEYGLYPVEPVLKTGAAGGREYFSETDNLKLWELVELKQKFDREVVNTMKEVFPYIPKKQMERLFTMPSKGLSSIWFSVLNSDLALRRYFNFKKHIIYKTFDELSSDEFKNYFPQRTDQIFDLTPGGAVLERFDRKYSFGPAETRMFHLSGGRLKYTDILKIIEKEFEGIDGDKALKEFYCKLDSIYGIVFARI